MWEVLTDGKEPYPQLKAKEVRPFIVGGGKNEVPPDTPPDGISSFLPKTLNIYSIRTAAGSYLGDVHWNTSQHARGGQDAGELQGAAICESAAAAQKSGSGTKFAFKKFKEEEDQKTKSSVTTWRQGEEDPGAVSVFV